MLLHDVPRELLCGSERTELYTWFNPQPFNLDRATELHSLPFKVLIYQIDRNNILLGE